MMTYIEHLKQAQYHLSEALKLSHRSQLGPLLAALGVLKGQLRWHVPISPQE